MYYFLMLNPVIVGQYVCTGILIAIIVTSILVYLISIKKPKRGYNSKSDDDVSADTVERGEVKTSTTEEFNFDKTKSILIKYNKSFTAKLIQSSKETKEFYVIIKNYLLSFKSIKSRVSWKADAFNMGRKQIAKLTIKGKTLNLHLALNPADYADVKFKVFDKSDSKIYANVPLAYKVKSNRAVKNAFKLIDELLKPITVLKDFNDVTISAKNYPYEDTNALIIKGLIKVKSKDGKEITDIDNAVKPFVIRKSVTVEQAHSEITDEVAMSLVVRGNETKKTGKKFAVNIDVLALNFNTGDTVDIEVLKEKGIVPKNVKAIKILARGYLDKRLTVIADNYSADAIKMIVLVGGTAKLK